MTKYYLRNFDNHTPGEVRAHILKMFLKGNEVLLFNITESYLGKWAESREKEFIEPRIVTINNEWVHPWGIKPSFVERTIWFQCLELDEILTAISMLHLFTCVSITKGESDFRKLSFVLSEVEGVNCNALIVVEKGKTDFKQDILSQIAPLFGDRMALSTSDDEI